MNYNNYNNPYNNTYGNQYSYNTYPNNNAMQNQQSNNNYYMQNPQQNYPNMFQNPQQQISYTPLVYVSGIEGAKAFILAPNQNCYLKDSESNKIFFKSADNEGKFTMKTYLMIEEKPNNDNNKSNVEYALKNDLEAIKKDFEIKIDNLSKELKNTLKMNNSGNYNNSNKYNNSNNKKEE